MNNYHRNRRGRGLTLFLILSVIAIGFVTLRSSARTSSVSITITNNSPEGIEHIFLSPTDRDKWGANQLTATLGTGTTVTLSGVACDQTDLKVIAENQDGCFFYSTVSCGQDSSWTIAKDASPDCGN
jgi:hypothetical protein